MLKLRALCTGRFCIELLVAWNHKNVCKHSGAVLHPPSAPVWCNHKVIIIQFDVKIMTMLMMLMMMLTGLQRPGTGVVFCQQAACVPEVAILLAWCCCSASYCRQFLMCYFSKASLLRAGTKQRGPCCTACCVAAGSAGPRDRRPWSTVTGKQYRIAPKNEAASGGFDYGVVCVFQRCTR